MSNRVRFASPEVRAAGENLVESTQGGSSLESGTSSSGPSHMSVIASSLPAPGTGAGLHGNLNPGLVNQQVRTTRALSPSLFGPELRNDVIIIISLTPRTPVTLRFECDLLRRRSPLLARKIHDYGFTPRGPMWLWIKLVKADGAVKVMTRMTKDTFPNPQVPSKFDIRDNPNDYEEDILLQDLYIQLLGTFHNNPVPVRADSIHTALKQCELYLKHAAVFEITHLIRSHLSMVLLGYGIALYKAIAINPVPFLLISHKLQDRQIYQEALIHVGTFLYSPWLTSRDILPPQIEAVIEHKTANLLRVVQEAESGVKLINLKVIDQATRNITLPGSLKGNEIGVSVVTKWWRSSFARDFNTLKNRGDGMWKMHMGSFFRDLFQGTRDWMRFDPLRMERETGVMVLDDRVVRECIERLREKTSGIVRELAISGLMIDPATNGIHYLTCVEVNNYDIPWEREFGQQRSIPTHGLT